MALSSIEESKSKTERHTRKPVKLYDLHNIILTYEITEDKVDENNLDVHDEFIPSYTSIENHQTIVHVIIYIYINFDNLKYIK